MWIILGTAAIVSAILNVYFTLRHRDAKWFRIISLSLIALTLCAWYSLDARWVEAKDWAALEDTGPTMTKAFWSLTIASIVINSVSLFTREKYRFRKERMQIPNRDISKPSGSIDTAHED